MSLTILQWIRMPENKHINPNISTLYDMVKNARVEWMPKPNIFETFFVKYLHN